MDEEFEIWLEQQNIPHLGLTANVAATNLARKAFEFAYEQGYNDAKEIFAMEDE